MQLMQFVIFPNKFLRLSKVASIFHVQIFLLTCVGVPNICEYSKWLNVQKLFLSKVSLCQISPCFQYCNMMHVNNTIPLHIFAWYSNLNFVIMMPMTNVMSNIDMTMLGKKPTLKRFHLLDPTKVTELNSPH